MTDSCLPINEPSATAADLPIDIDVDLQTIKQIIDESYNTALSHGWYEDGDPPILERLMLMVSELSEACEEYRQHGLDPNKYIYQAPNGKWEGIGVELADVVIRIADFCGRHNIPLGKALRLKMDYNKSRPYRHGGKLA